MTDTTDTSEDGLTDERAMELDLDPNHTHHPAFVEALDLIDEHDPDFVTEFVELLTAQDHGRSGAVDHDRGVPFYAYSLLENYVELVDSSPDLVPELNRQLLAETEINDADRQLAFLRTAANDSLETIAADGRLGDTDWDDDGLDNWAEYEHGTDPMDPDTSGDGLYDGEAVSLRLDPTAVHEEIGEIATAMRSNAPLSGPELEYLGIIYRNDEYHNSQIRDIALHEQGSITEKELRLASDIDGDGLITAIEEQIGTDPEEPDTSGDLLYDGWKYMEETTDGAELPRASPNRKDLYVQFLYGPDAQPLSASEKSTLEEWWAAFDIENLDGSSGITLHIDDSEYGGRVNERPESVLDGRGDVRDYRGTFYNDEYMGERVNVYHLVVIDSIDWGNLAGQAVSGGWVSVVNTGMDSDSRLRTISHELLHNIVGELDEEYVTDEQLDCGSGAGQDRYHTCSGLLATPSEGTGIPSELEAQIQHEGFESEDGEAIGECISCGRGQTITE